MHCKICGTDYLVQWGIKGRGCTNKRNHKKYLEDSKK